MATKDQRYRGIGILLCVLGSALLAIALAEELFGVTVFSESPVLVGTAVAFIGALLASGRRRSAAGPTGNRTPPRP